MLTAIASSAGRRPQGSVLGVWSCGSTWVPLSLGEGLLALPPTSHHWTVQISPALPLSMGGGLIRGEARSAVPCGRYPAGLRCREQLRHIPDVPLSPPPSHTQEGRLTQDCLW